LKREYTIKSFFDNYRWETLFFLLITFILFAFNGSISLWDQDEAAYAGFAKNMIQSGNWLIPDYLWSEIHRKTPLHFWNIALSSQVFGINEFSVRFPSTISILLTYVTLFFWGGKFFGRKVSFYSAIVLSTSLFVPVLAKVSVTDGTLLFLSTLSAFSIIELLLYRNRWATLVFWVCIALAVLLKGPPILIFTGVYVVLLFILHPNRKNLLGLHPWFFFPLSLLPIYYWGYLANQQDGGTFVAWLLDWYILKRISGSVLGQTGPPGLHFLFIIAFFTPYLLFFPKAIWKAIQSVFKDKGHNLILGTWFVAGWLFYEFSPSKLPAYAVVAHVPLAILIGKIILEHIHNKTKPEKIWFVLHFIVNYLVIIGLFVASIILKLSFTIQVCIAVFVVLQIIISIYGLKRKTFKDLVTTIIIMNLCFQFSIWVILMPQIDNYKDSTRKVGDYIIANSKLESIVAIGNDAGHPPSLPYYASRAGHKVIEELNHDSLFFRYISPKPYVLILNRSLLDHFNKYLSDVEAKEFSSFFVDRKGKAFYYVIMNDAARKD
jgi:4-amino-4-deoxy-L-arabinose transferase-like glycosyltransferase